jgi:putative spermidine/putrescine transport system permease protein
LAVTVFLLIGALTGALWTSLHPGAIVGGATGLDAWREVLRDPHLWEALAGSLELAAVVTVVAVPLSIVLAALVRRSRVALIATGLPVAVPHLVVGVVVVALLGPGGMVDRLVGGMPVRVVGDPLGLGMVLAYTVKEVPFLALVVLAGWDDDTDDLLDAARSLGASRWRRSTDVLLPRVGPGVAVGAAVVGAFVVGAAEVPVLVGSGRRSTLAMYAIDATRVGGPAARPVATAALLLTAGASMGLAALPLWWVRRRGIR